jgi:hypothetical protein
MQKWSYEEPDGYIKMRFRDLVAGAIVVACFALAALMSQLWRTTVIKTGQKLPAILIKLAKQKK